MALNAFSVLFFLGLGIQAGLCVDSMMRQEQALDIEKTFVFGWEINGPESKIIIDVIAKTKGWIGIGFAPKSSMKGSDLLIGGVSPDGKPYYKDYHATDNTMPLLDKQQDWVLENAVENETHTYLKLSRALDTCDNDDIPVTRDTVNVIWSYGATDDLTKKHSNRGGRQFNLLDPVEPPFDSDSLEKWEVLVKDPLPAVETTYFCTIHKLTLLTKKYMIALEANLPSEDALRHTHHFTATACDQKDKAVLAELVELEKETHGRDCYSGKYGALKPKCNAILFGWATGGKRIVLPEHLGVAVGGDGEDTEDLYVMFEVHYDNPDLKADLDFETGFNLYFTDKPRQNEGSVLMVGANILPSLLIPPETEKYVISGHCSSDYTKAFVPKDGVNIVSVNMHSHLRGRRLKVRHFRGEKELAPLLSDENYDFDYQQTRELPEEVKLLPGDHLTMECEMSSIGEKSVTFAGESTREEMCHVFLFYYPKMDLLSCRSGFPLEKLYEKFGIEAVNESPVESDGKTPTGFPLDPKITEPAALKDKHVQEVINGFKWTPEYTKKFEDELRYGEHVSYFSFSAVAASTLADTRNYTSYPKNFEEYITPDQCEVNAVPTTTENTQTGSTDGNTQTGSTDGNTEPEGTTTEKSGNIETSTSGVGKQFGSLILTITFIVFSTLIVSS